MLKSLLTTVSFFCLLSIMAQVAVPERIRVEGEIKDAKQNPVSYAHILSKSTNSGWVGDYYGKFRIEVSPGDTLIISAISFHHAIVLIPVEIKENTQSINITLQNDTVNLREIVIHPFPATFEQLRQEFMKVEVEDPLANLDLHLPSPEELKMETYSLEGGFGIRLPLVSMIYNQFSREAKFKKNFDEAMNREKAYSRYNTALIIKITGLKNEDDIRKFMEFCALQIKFILESSDYELYAAILNCYDDFCKTGLVPGSGGE
jgi:hypothetical protein